jgi:hypothetical protein
MGRSRPFGARVSHETRPVRVPSARDGCPHAPQYPGDVAATRRRGRPPKLLVELLVILVLMAAAAVGIYFGFRSPPIHDTLPLGGRNVDVSRSSAAQFEASVAADPTNAKVLLAASMDDLADARVYVSTDGGANWTSRPAPPAERGNCGLSHPAVAMGPGGLQVYASLVTDTCQPPDPLLYVATRHGAAGAWTVRRVGATRRFAYDQRPAVAVDGKGTVYVAWPRLLGEFTSHQVLQLSRSTDGGNTWSPPRRVGRYSSVYGVDLATAGDGVLYLAVSDGRRRRVDLLRSGDAGATWSRPRRVGGLAERYVVGCGAGAVPIAAQPQRRASVGDRAAADRCGDGEDRSVPADGCVRPFHRRPVALLLRHARRLDTEARVVHVHALAERRPRLAAARSCRVGELRRDGHGC